MKKTVIAALAAALCLASCSKEQKPKTIGEYLDMRLAECTTFEDSLVAIDGTFIGGVSAMQARMQAEQKGQKVHMDEVIRGIRDVMGVDTANTSYLYGLQMGMQVLDIYREVASTESINREALLHTITAAMGVDSLSEEQVMALQPQFQEMFFKVNQRAQARRDSIAMSTEAARQNRMMADAVAEKLQKSPEFKAVGSDGIMQHIITPGNGESLDSPNRKIEVSYAITTIDGNRPIHQQPARSMFVGRPTNEVLANVLPFMQMGEEAEFFVPYQLAYGASGNERLGVGPCQSVMIKVTVQPAAK